MRHALAYVSGEYHHAESFEKLKARLEELDRAHKLNGNRLFYLATPPEIYPTIIEQLEKAGLSKHPNGKSWTRVIIEKPYGRDLASARKLNETVRKAFDESQVYRIDHYLGKRYGAEPDGAALRQRNFRAAVEPQLCGPRANHGGGNARRGAACGIL